MTCTETDLDGDTDGGTVTVTVTPIDDGDPICVDDTVTCPENTPTTVPVLGNDTAVDGPVVVTCGQGTHGTTAVNPDGTVAYTPDSDYTGPDSWSYTVTDLEGDTDSGTVTVEVVIPGAAIPVCVDDTGTCAEGGTTTVPVLDNDTGLEDGPIVVTCTPGGHGTTIVNPDKTVTYTPDEGFTGSDPFPYTVTGLNRDSDPGTATVVGGAPLSGYPDDVSVAGGGCDAGGDASGSAGLALVGLALVAGSRSRRRRAA